MSLSSKVLKVIYFWGAAFFPSGLLNHTLHFPVLRLLLPYLFNTTISTYILFFWFGITCFDSNNFVFILHTPDISIKDYGVPFPVYSFHNLLISQKAVKRRDFLGWSSVRQPAHSAHESCVLSLELSSPHDAVTKKSSNQRRKKKTKT